MIYFHLNADNFINPMFKGIANNQGRIMDYFYEHVLAEHISKERYIGAWSEDPEFQNVECLKDRKILLEMIDNEAVNVSPDEILRIIEEAHEITIPIVGKSLNELGLHYEYITTINNKDVENALWDWMAENNYQNLEESIGKANMPLEEKINFLATELKNINSQGDAILIIDPYIFPMKHDDDYIQLFCGIIEKCEASAIKVITKESNCNTSLQCNIKELLNIGLTVYYSNTLHDRWWIVEKSNSGFISGPSLNGVGKGKLTTIKQLDESEVRDILSSFQKIL